jgi:putative addiction module component (TIGR02574 family)
MRGIIADSRKLIDEAIKLPPEARAALAGALIESLDEAVDEDAAAAWEAELAARVRELDAKSVKPIPWREARRIIAGWPWDLPIEFHPAAAAEAAAARAWYAARIGSAAASLPAEIDLACERFAGAFHRHPVHVSGTRRYLMRRSPFHVVDCVPADPGEPIVFVAVAHGYRRPGHWHDRST